jgi:hypothetical protein
VAAIKIPTFGGMRPAQDDRLLPETAAALSENTWLYSGKLQGIHAPTLIRECDSPTTSKVFRIPNNYLDAEHLADADWIEFEDPDTDVIRAPVNDDTFDRYYWASSSNVPMYNTRERIASGDTPYILGVPDPTTAPTVSPTGGVGAASTRSYVYTWVSAYGEEGPPSPPQTVTGKVDDTWGITLSAAAADDIAGPDRNLTLVRIYRTVTSGSGAATFFLVAEQDIADTTYSDTATDAVVTLNSQLESTNWSGPPALTGWVVLGNGIVAGWIGKEVWFSEPYRPHAWPASYALTVDNEIMGLGVVGQTLVVCTQGFPVAFSGVHPASMTESKLSSFEPCTSRGSIVSTTNGVYYASPNGLILVAGNGAVNITRNLITKDRWTALVPTSSLRAALIGDAYYAYGSVRFGVFETTAFETTAFTQQDFTGSYNGVLIDPQNERVAFNVLSNDVPCVNSLNDAFSGELFVIRDGSVYWINIADEEPEHEAFTWRSKIFQPPVSKNLSVFKVYFSVPDTAPTLNPVRNTSLVQTLQADQYGLVRVYADGNLVCTRELRESGELMRIPSGFTADFWQFEIEGRVDVLSLQAATSAKELATV